MIVLKAEGPVFSAGHDLKELVRDQSLITGRGEGWGGCKTVGG